MLVLQWTYRCCSVRVMVFATVTLTEANLRVGHSESKGRQKAEVDRKDGEVDAIK